MATAVQALSAIPTAWKVGLTIVTVAASLAAASQTGLGLIHLPRAVAAEDSASRAQHDSSLAIARDQLKQQKLTNCILLGLESRLSCSVRFSH